MAEEGGGGGRTRKGQKRRDLHINESGSKMVAMKTEKKRHCRTVKMNNNECTIAQVRTLYVELSIQIKWHVSKVYFWWLDIFFFTSMPFNSYPIICRRHFFMAHFFVSAFMFCLKFCNFSTLPITCENKTFESAELFSTFAHLFQRPIRALLHRPILPCHCYFIIQIPCTKHKYWAPSTTRRWRTK